MPKFSLDMTDEQLIAALPNSELKYIREHNSEQFAEFRKTILPALVEEVDFDFSGKNCDDCSGWDGVSRRCNCGNRRVEWVYWTYWYGEAY